MVAKLGSFLVDIDTSVNSKGINSLAKSLGSLTGSALKFGAVLGAATLGAGYGLTKLVKNTANETAELGRLAKDLVTTPNFLEKFSRVFEMAGSSASEAKSIISSLQQQIQGFKWGDKGNIETFGLLQLDPQELGRGIEKDFDAVRKAFNRQSPKDQLLFVNRIGFGQDALRVLRMSTKEYNNALSVASKIPLATQKQIDNAELAKKSFTELDQTWGAFKRNLVSGAIPALTKFSDEMMKVLNNPETQKKMAETLGKFFEVLPKLIELLPKLAEAIIKIADVFLPDKIDKETDEKPYFMRQIQRVVNNYQSAGIFTKNPGEAWKKNTLKRRIEDATGSQVVINRNGISQQDIDKHIAKNGDSVTRIIQTSPKSTSSNSTQKTYNINMPIQNAGGNLDTNKMKQFSNILKDTFDKEMQMTSENFKSGSIQ